MNLLLTFGTAIVAGLAIDVIAFRGELTGFVRDEILMARARRQRPDPSRSAARTSRRRASENR